MAKDDGGAVFNIGSQKGNITNVGRDLDVRGGFHQHATLGADLSAVISQLRREADVLGLPAEAAVALDEAEAAAADPAPDPPRVAAALERFTKIADGAAGLATSGSGLVKALKMAAQVLGPIGATLLALLPL